MLVSRKLLEEFVDLSGLSEIEIANTLTFAGIEVESVTKLAYGDKLVIGEVLECSKVIGSDHLSLTKVNLGSKHGVSQIICGAPNIAKGQKVIVALPGCNLPSLTIKKATIKGIESSGMICSLLELGVDHKFLSEAQTSGIEVLPSDAPIGEENVLGYLELDDTVFDVRPLPNRSDTMAVLNLAKELAALFKREYKEPKLEKNKEEVSKATVDSKTPSCPLFYIKEVYGLKTGPSPRFIQRYLMASGQRSINNIVDIGNFIMLLTGQPLHMYDIDKLTSLDFVVRDDLDTKFLALDEKEYDITKGDICITVDGEIMCLGGVMGAKSCEVDETSTNIAIEAAQFSGAQIRRTSTRLNLVSEASKRFARGFSGAKTGEILELTAMLLRKYAGVKKESETTKFDTLDHTPQVVKASDKKINSLLGTSFTSREIDEVLERLNMKVERTGIEMNVTIPHYRIDIEGAPDLAEEVIRLLGFEHIKEELPIMPTAVGGRTEVQQKTFNLRTYLRNRGLYETINYTLTDKDSLKRFDYFSKGETYEVLNPMTPLHQYVRLSLLASLLDSALYNYSRQLSDFGLFEISEVYDKKRRNTHLAIVLVGEEHLQGALKKRAYDYYSVKGYFDAILTELGLNESRFKIVPFTKSSSELHPYRSVEILLSNERVAILGELHPKLRDKMNFKKTRVAVLEVNLSALFALKVSPIKMSEIAKYPSVSRDFALIMDKDINASDVLKTVERVNTKLISKVELFDVYIDERLGENKKSLAINVTYRASDKTLEEAEIIALDKAIVDKLKEKFKVTLRDG